MGKVKMFRWKAGNEYQVSDPNQQNILFGDIFEITFLAATKKLVREGITNFNHNMPERKNALAPKPGRVRPDGLMAYKSASGYTFANGLFFEMKAGSQKLTYTYSDKNPYQLSAMIWVLANMPSKENKNVKGSDVGTNAITFVTPATDAIDESLVTYAANQNVKIYQMETYYYFDKKGNPVFRFKYKLRNRILEPIELNTLNNKEVIIQYSKGYNFYRKR